MFLLSSVHTHVPFRVSDMQIWRGRNLVCWTEHRLAFPVLIAVKAVTFLITGSAAAHN